MSDKERPAGSDAETEPPSTGGAPGAADAEKQEGWFDRIKAAVGLKGPASFRSELEAELASGETEGSFTDEERLMLRNILRLRDMRVEDVMVPRADIDAVENTVTLGELLREFEDSGHSRMPVYRGTLDEPIGMVHIKDLIGYVTRAAITTEHRAESDASGHLDLDRIDLLRPLSELSLIRNVLFVPPSMPAATLLATMQANRMQMALVVDEYGGTDGLVSLEDIVEVVVGDIEDEHDEAEGPMVVAEGDGVFLADARADLEEVAEAIGDGFASAAGGEDVDTVGGLVYSLIGRIPVRGELITVPGGYELEILDADPRRIKRLRIYRTGADTARGEMRRRPRPAEGTPGA